MIVGNDKVVIAWYSSWDGQPFDQVFGFKGLKPGSPARAARVSEYERIIEALKGQGCQVHVWDLEWWNRGYREKFRRCQLRRKAESEYPAFYEHQGRGD